MNVEFDRHGAFARAVAFCAYAHDGQNREGTALPYALHPMETAAIASTMTNDPDVLTAAVLHASAQCGVSSEELRLRFGRRAAQLAFSMADDSDEDASGTWQKRRLRAVNRLLVAPREELILTLADCLSHLRALERDLRLLGPLLWQRSGQPNPSMHCWYYSSIGEALRPIADFDAYREYMALVRSIFGLPDRK